MPADSLPDLEQGRFCALVFSSKYKGLHCRLQRQQEFARLAFPIKMECSDFSVIPVADGERIVVVVGQVKTEGIEANRQCLAIHYNVHGAEGWMKPVAGIS